MVQIPSYVTAVPDGTETGLYLAVDLGGTNLRICSVDLHGDTTFSITQSKSTIPVHLITAKYFSELFAYVAEQIKIFLQHHHDNLLQGYQGAGIPGNISNDYGSKRLLLGLTFSFTFEKQALNRGTMLRWTKGFNIPDAMGKDISTVFQTEIDKLNLPVLVVALVNDTVGALLARSYTSPSRTKTLLGAIFGTGTNGAYVEKMQNITKLHHLGKTADGEMIINTEWGSFDNELLVLPTTPYDVAVDAESVHPGIQLFEKRISGMYLGEVLRHVVLAMVSNATSIDIPSGSKLNRKYAIDSSFLSMAAADDSEDLSTLRKQLYVSFGFDASMEVAEAVKILALAIGGRAARLSGVAIAAVVLKSGRLSSSEHNQSSKGSENDQPNMEGWTSKSISKTTSPVIHCNPISTYFRSLLSVIRRWTRFLFPGKSGDEKVPEDQIVDIGVDGSLFEFYPGFEEGIRSTLIDVDGIGHEGARKIRFGLARDGSGVGAALVARMAEQEQNLRDQHYQNLHYENGH